MRTINLTALLLVMLTPGVAFAQAGAPSTAPAPAPAPAPAAGVPAYSTSTTDLGTLLGNVDTKAVLVKYVPELVNNDQISMASGMTLKAVQSYSPDTLTDQTLANIDAELAKVPVKK